MFEKVTSGHPAGYRGCCHSAVVAHNPGSWQQRVLNFSRKVDFTIQQEFVELVVNGLGSVHSVSYRSAGTSSHTPYVLRRVEGAAHVQAMVALTPPLSAIRVRAFAGPSFFRVQQDTINEIIYNQLSNGVGGNSEPGGNRVDRLRTPHARVACEADEVLLEIVRVIRQRGILDAQLHTCSARDAVRCLRPSGATDTRRSNDGAGGLEEAAARVLHVVVAVDTSPVGRDGEAHRGQSVRTRADAGRREPASADFQDAESASFQSGERACPPAQPPASVPPKSP